MSAEGKAKELADAIGYDSVDLVCAWRGMSVYGFYNANGPEGETGLPSFILATDEGARMSTTDEAFAIIDTLPE